MAGDEFGEGSTHFGITSFVPIDLFHVVVIQYHQLGKPHREERENGVAIEAVGYNQIVDGTRGCGNRNRIINLINRK